MKKALLVIDYTNDFVADDGALTCGKVAQDLEDTIITYIKKFCKERELVIYSNDTHIRNDEYHPESTLFPPHNINGTYGRFMYGKLGSNEFSDELVKECFNNAHISEVSKHMMSINKTRYSAFHGTNLETILRERGINEIYLTGVCTDICILHTAVDAYNKGFKVTVIESAVASFNQQGHEWALQHFKNSLGFNVIK